MTDEEFIKFIDDCYEELGQKQKSLISNYGINKYEKYWYDLPTKTLHFTDNEKVKLEFEVIFIGTWACQKNTWMWGWANESFTDETRKDAARLIGLKDLTGFEVFEIPVFDSTETMAHETTAMAVNYLKALGMYRVPGEKNHLFLALMAINQSSANS